jgi:solute carrier family 25 carnitine/acylcarnitine transporter 20/29
MPAAALDPERQQKTPSFSSILSPLPFPLSTILHQTFKMAPSTPRQINEKVDSLPPTISSKVPRIPETKEALREEVVEAKVKSLSGLRSLAAGGFGGVCAVIVGHPFDLVKVRLQTAEKGVYKGAIDVVTKSVAKDGLARGLYAGVSAPLVGVTPMCMSSFISYSKLRRKERN